jgi:hypothetical protein
MIYTVTVDYTIVDDNKNNIIKQKKYVVPARDRIMARQIIEETINNNKVLFFIHEGKDYLSNLNKGIISSIV